MSMLRLAEMKGSFTLLASALTASTAAFTSSASAHPYPYSKQVNVDSSISSEEKFAPRFDGLRFMETLVTAHR